MKEHISFGSTPKFDTIVYEARGAAIDKWQRDNKREYVDAPLDLPTVTCFGTEKMHGTNASVCYNSVDGFWIQARNRIIDIGDDNYGCASAALDNKDAWMSLILDLAVRHNIDLTLNTITVYYEWAGANIQGENSGVSGLSKSAFIFQYARVSAKCVHITWIDTKGLYKSDNNIYNLLNYKTYEVDLNLNDLDACNTMLDMITYEQVEVVSPVGKDFGLENVGEGVYYTCTINGELMRFKHKGELHGGKPKEKKVKVPVDDDRVIYLMSIADIVTPTWRLTQAIQETGAKTMQNIGDVIKFVQNDIIKEEQLLLKEVNVELRDITKYVVNITKNYFIGHIKG